MISYTYWKGTCSINAENLQTVICFNAPVQRHEMSVYKAVFDLQVQQPWEWVSAHWCLLYCLSWSWWTVKKTEQLWSTVTAFSLKSAIQPDALWNQTLKVTKRIRTKKTTNCAFYETSVGFFSKAMSSRMFPRHEKHPTLWFNTT